MIIDAGLWHTRRPRLETNWKAKIFNFFPRIQHRALVSRARSNFATYLQKCGMALIGPNLPKKKIAPRRQKDLKKLALARLEMSLCHFHAPKIRPESAPLPLSKKMAEGIDGRLVRT